MGGPILPSVSSDLRVVGAAALYESRFAAGPLARRHLPGQPPGGRRPAARQSPRPARGGPRSPRLSPTQPPEATIATSVEASRALVRRAVHAGRGGRGTDAETGQAAARNSACARESPRTLARRGRASPRVGVTARALRGRRARSSRRHRCFRAVRSGCSESAQPPTSWACRTPAPMPPFDTAARRSGAAPRARGPGQPPGLRGRRSAWLRRDGQMRILGDNADEGRLSCRGSQLHRPAGRAAGGLRSRIQAPQRRLLDW